MTRDRRTILILAALALVVAGTGFYWLTRPHLPRYRNSALAREIQPGATRREVVKLLGDPIGETNGWTLFFPSPTGYAIRAKFGPDGRIQSINVGDGKVRDLTN